MAGSGHRRLSAPSGTGDRRAGASDRTRLPDRYQPIGLVARGGMACVWEARDRKLDRRVAVKLLAEPFARNEAAVRRFKREARTAARLSGHSNVVTIYDVGQRPASEEAPYGRPFIVMEFLAGGTVADAMRLGAVTETEAVQWLHDAAAALDHAHQRGVVHRDVKPSNLLLDDHRVLHVADFGIASLGTEDTLSASGQLLGTAAYLAPERALGRPATAASDRYSLAVAAFELLVGERPFAEHGAAAALARQHVEAPPPRASARNPALPRSLDRVLERGMAKDPEQRWSTGVAFAEATERALARTRRSPRTAAAAFRSGARRRGAAAAAVAVAALIAGIAAAASGTGSQAPSRAVASGRAIAHPPPPLTSARTRHAAPRPHPTTGAPTTPLTGTSAAPALSADALESRGHALMESGDYAAAIPVLRRALAAASPGSLTYAYALYDLGRSLRLAGNPQAAIPILWRRLSIPNQTGVVRTELQLAMQAAGRGRPANQGRTAGQTSGGTAPAVTGKRRHHHHGHWGSGGAGLAQGQGD